MGDGSERLILRGHYCPPVDVDSTGREPRKVVGKNESQLEAIHAVKVLLISEMRIVVTLDENKGAEEVEIDYLFAVGVAGDYETGFAVDMRRPVVISANRLVDEALLSAAAAVTLQG